MSQGEWGSNRRGVFENPHATDAPVSPPTFLERLHNTYGAERPTSETAQGNAADLGRVLRRTDPNASFIKSDLKQPHVGHNGEEVVLPDKMIPTRTDARRRTRRRSIINKNQRRAG